MPGLESIGLGFNFSGVLGTLWSVGSVFFKALFGLIFVFALYWFWYRPRQFKTTVVLHAKRGDTWVEAFDKAKVSSGSWFEKSPVKVLKLFKRKNKLPMPDYEYVQRGERGDIIHFAKYGESDFVPLKVSVSANPGISFVSAPQDIKLWWLTESRDLIRRNTMSSFLSKYGTFIALGGVIILIIIVAWMVNGTMKQEISAAVQVAESLKETSANIAAARGVPV